MSPPVPSDLGYVPPDGGWGWAVVFGASVSVGFAYTFPKAFTIYFKELQAVYGISYSQIAWITSIMCATTYGGGKWSKTVSFFGEEEVWLLQQKGRGECVSLRKFLERSNCKFGTVFWWCILAKQRKLVLPSILLTAYMMSPILVISSEILWCVGGGLAVVELFESRIVISGYLVLCLLFYSCSWLSFWNKKRISCTHGCREDAGNSKPEVLLMNRHGTHACKSWDSM